MRIAVLGDASGWLSPTLAALRGLGVQVDLDHFDWPDDLVVVHVGDLVHKGPDGDDLVAWVDAAMERVGDRWIQLLGNHEASYLGGAVFGADYGCWDLRPETVTTLRGWLSDDRVRLAAVLQDAGGEEWLITHAGLTGGTWDDLGMPAGAPLISGHLNDMLVLDPRRAFCSGEMLHHQAEPSVVWASEGELCRSWDGRAMPCSQIRGHTNPYDFSRQGWRSALPPEVCRAASAATTPADEEGRHLRLPLGGRTVLCVDPGFSSRRPRHRLAPLLVDGQILPDTVPSARKDQSVAWGPPARNQGACTSSWDWPVQLDGLSYEDETVSFGPVSWERLEALLSGNHLPAQAVQASPQVQDAPLVESRPERPTERNAPRRERPERRHGRRRWWLKSC